jgi:hypothetical protein
MFLILDVSDVFGRGLNRLDKASDPQDNVGVHHMRRMDAANDQLPAVSMLDDDRPRPGT